MCAVISSPVLNTEKINDVLTRKDPTTLFCAVFVMVNETRSTSF